MDTDPLARDLLEHRDFLLRLAAGLVGRSDAEDLVQDVWTRALEHPRLPEPGARAWLARVTRNLAVSRFRALDRRRRRERDHAVPGPDSDAGAVEAASERFELAQSLVAAVRALEEPYRGVVLLRFFEGLDHRTIAARLGVPIATVRTRQQRALARLRERLDRQHGGREAWSVLVGTWAAQAGGPVPAAGGGALLVAGVAVLLGGVGFWRFLGHGGSEVPEPLAVHEPRAAPEGVREPGASPAVRTSSASARQVFETPRPMAPHTLVVGRVEGLTPAELGAAHVEIEAKWKRYNIQPPLVRVDVRPDGTFEAEVDEQILFAHQWAYPQPPDVFLARAEHPLHLGEPASVPFASGVRDHAGDLRLDAGALAMRDAATLRGRVVQPDGSPATGAAVEAYALDGGEPRTTAEATERCDEDGRFDLRLERAGAVAVVALSEGLRPGCVKEEARLGELRELGDIRLETGHVLAGQVLRLGQPMPRATVTIADEEPGRLLMRAGGLPLAWIDGRPEWSRVQLESDAEGRFESVGFAPRAYRVEARGTASMASLPLHTEGVSLTAPRTGIALDFSFSLVTLVRAPGSASDVEGWVHVRRAGVEQNGLWLARAEQEGGESGLTLVAQPSTAYEFSIELVGLAPFTLELVTPGPGEELRRTLAYDAPAAPATLELEWSPPQGSELDALQVTFVDPDGRQVLQRSFLAREFEAGLVRVEKAPIGRHRVILWPGWSRFERFPLLPDVLDVELTAGATRRERIAFEPAGLLRVDVRAPSGERRGARVRLLDARGVEVPAIFHVQREGIDLSETWSLTPWSVHESEALPAGAYELVLWDEDAQELRQPLVLRKGEVTELELVLQAK